MSGWADCPRAPLRRESGCSLADGVRWAVASVSGKRRRAGKLQLIFTQGESSFRRLCACRELCQAVEGRWNQQSIEPICVGLQFVFVVFFTFLFFYQIDKANRHDWSVGQEVLLPGGCAKYQIFVPHLHLDNDLVQDVQYICINLVQLLDFWGPFPLWYHGTY